MRIFGKLLPVFRLTRRISCSSIAPHRLPYCGNVLQNPRIVVTTLHSFGTKSGNSKFINRKIGRNSRRLIEKNKSKSSERLPKPSTSKNSVHLKDACNIMPVGLINQNIFNAPSIKVLLIPINIFEGEDDAVQKTLATLSIIRDNARQIEAFTNNLPSTPFIDVGALPSGGYEKTYFQSNISSKNSNVTSTTETPILNEYDSQDEVTFWQHPEPSFEQGIKNPNTSYDDLEQIAEQEINRVQMHDSFDVSSWNESKKNLFAPLSRSLEEKLSSLPIASMQLGFEMDMTNVKDALMKASLEPSTPQAKLEGVLAKPRELRRLKEPTLALTTCFEIVPAPETKKVPLNFNALIQGVVEIDASKISLEELRNIRIPEFNDCITAIAANICSTALKKGFPTDFSRMSLSTRPISGRYDDKISNVCIGSTDSPRNGLTASTPTKNKAEFFSTQSNEPQTRNPHIVCIREGSKGCISPGNADNPFFIPSKSASKKSASDTKCQESRGSLMSCKAYANAIEEAAKRREASKKKSKDSCKPKKSSKTDCGKKKAAKNADPCKEKGKKEKKKDPCKSADKKTTAKKSDPCKTGDKKSSEKKKDPCKSADKKTTAKKSDPCKTGDKKSADKKKDPCKSGDKKAADKKKDPCKSSKKKQDSCKSGDKKSGGKKMDPCKSEKKDKTSCGSVSKKSSCGSTSSSSAKKSKKNPCEDSKKAKSDDKKPKPKGYDPCKNVSKKSKKASAKKDKKEQKPKYPAPKCPPPKDKKSDKKGKGKKKESSCDKFSRSSTKPNCEKKGKDKDGSNKCKSSDSKKKSDPCKKSDSKKKSDPCKKADKKDSKSKCGGGSSSKKPDPCKKSDSKKKSDPCKKSDSKKKSDPCKKADKKDSKSKCGSGSSSKKADPCKKGDSKKKSDPCKKSEKKDTKPKCGSKKADSSKKGDKKKSDSCKKSDSKGSSKKTNPCKKSDSKGSSKKTNPCKKSYSTEAFPTVDSLLKRCCDTLYHSSLKRHISSLTFQTFRLFSSKKGNNGVDFGKESRCNQIGPKRRRNRKDIKKRTKLMDCQKDYNECPKVLCKNPPCGQLKVKGKRKKLGKCKKVQVCKQTFEHCYPGKHEQSDCKGDKKACRPFSTVAIRNNRNENCEGETKLKPYELKNEILRITDVCQISTVSEVIPKFSEYDVLIQTDSVAISETDLHVFETGGKSCPGVTLGHDASGVIVKVGKCIQNLKPGDRVVIESGLSCGICDFCKRGQYNICAQMIYNGFLAKYQVHPADLCHKLPDSVSMEEGCLAGILAMGCNACYKAPIKPTTNVLVLGSCPTAIAAGLCCQAIGANRVCFACTQDKNLEMIQKVFDFDCVCYEPTTRFQPLLESICELLRSWPDVVINCAISGATMDLSIMSLKPMGTCVLAKCDSECASFNAMEVLMKSLKIVPSFRSTNMFPTALQLMDCGIAPMGELIAECYKWEAAQLAFQCALHESNVGNMKVIVKCADRGNFKETKT